MAGLEVVLHGRLEDLETVLAVLLGRVHGQVGAAPSAAARRTAPGSLKRDADAGTDVGLAAGQVERLAQPSEDPLGDRHGPRRRCVTPGSSTANSSPPRRAAVSWSRRQARIRSAAPASSASPAEWPSESLTILKRSRSIRSTAAPASGGQRLLEVGQEQRTAVQPGEWSRGRLVRLGGAGVGEGEADVLGERLAASPGRSCPIPAAVRKVPTVSSRRHARSRARAWPSPTACGRRPGSGIAIGDTA